MCIRDRLKRIHQISGTHNQSGLAAYLGVRRSAVTNAKRTGMILSLIHI